MIIFLQFSNYATHYFKKCSNRNITAHLFKKKKSYAHEFHGNAYFLSLFLSFLSKNINPHWKFAKVHRITIREKFYNTLIHLQKIRSQI